MKKVYYFSASLSPLNDYWILKELLLNQVEVRIIDIYRLINDKSIDTVVENAQVGYYRVCNSHSEVIELIQSLIKGDVAFVPTGEGLSEEIRNLLAIKDVNVICDTTFSLPIVSLEMKMDENKHYNNPLLKILRVLRTKGIHGFLSHCFDFLKVKSPYVISITKKKNSFIINKTRENTYLITSGAKNHLAYPLVKDAYNHIKIGHYSVVCRESELEKVVDEPYWVFIDQALPFHRDAQRARVNYKPFAQDYYESLKCFFEKVEKESGKKVVIALHPRTSKNYSMFFDGFKTFKGMTEELVEYSEGIISHFSTCIYSAVYINKPIVIITNELMNIHHDVRRMYDFSKQLNKSIIDIDSGVDFQFENYTRLDEEAYFTFKENYIRQSDAKNDKAINILREKLKI